MNTEYKILHTLVKNGGSMSLADFMNSVVSPRSKRALYIRKVMRGLERMYLIDERSQLLTLTPSGYVRHDLLKESLVSERLYRTGEWTRWGITTAISVFALVRTFL